MMIETPRLRLREFTAGDASLIFELDQDPAVLQYVDGPVTLEEAEKEILPYFLRLSQDHPGFGFFAAFERASGEYIGWFHLRPVRDRSGEYELGYRLHRRAWGQGFATEGSRELIRRAFLEQGVQCVVALALLANVASTRVMTKCGLTPSSHFVEQSVSYPDKRAVKYSLERDTYLRSLPPIGA